MARPISGKTFVCVLCKKEFYRAKSEIGRGRTYYCSNKCSGLAHRGDKNPRWKGGKIWSSHKYVLVKLPENSTYRYEHRLVMEKHLGRKLLRTETVHHKDGDKKNNQLDNLEIMSLSAHQKLHNDHLLERHCWVCEEVGTREPHYCRGFCKKHYEKYRRRIKRMNWW